jgi:hypothetical protein
LRRYPEKSAELEHFIADPDAAVAFVAGQALLARDSRAAVRVWLKLLETNAPHGLAETLVESIGDHGDSDLMELLLERDRAAGGGTVWGQIAGRIMNLHGVDYLAGITQDNEEGRPSYWIECPTCKRSLGVRISHVGERVRCKNCRGEFALPKPRGEE